MHKIIKEYFDKQKTEKRQILEQIRDLIMQTFPGEDEDFIWGLPVYDKGRFYLASLKNQVNLGVSIIDLTDEEANMFEGGEKTARHIKVHNLLNDEDKKRIVVKLKLVKNKAGIPK